MRFDFLRCIQISAILLFIHFNAQNVFCESINVQISSTYEEVAGVTHVVSPDPDTGFTTIEQAINTAAPGDTVWIKDGVYYENIVLDKSLTLRSENGHRHTVVVAKDPNLPVVRTQISGTQTLLLQGLSFYSPSGAQATSIEMGAATNCQFKDIHIGWDHVKPVAVEISIQPNNIRLGEPVTITWHCRHALYCTIGPDIGSVAASGTMLIFPDNTTTFTISASTPVSSESSEAKVDVIVSKTHYRYDAKGQVIESKTEGYFR